jgi:hypothetical protein
LRFLADFFAHGVLRHCDPHPPLAVETIAAPEDLLRNLDRIVVRGSAVHRKAPERTQEPRVPTLAEEPIH